MKRGYTNNTWKEANSNSQTSKKSKVVVDSIDFSLEEDDIEMLLSPTKTTTFDKMVISPYIKQENPTEIYPKVKPILSFLYHYSKANIGIKNLMVRIIMNAKSGCYYVSTDAVENDLRKVYHFDPRYLQCIKRFFSKLQTQSNIPSGSKSENTNRISNHNMVLHKRGGIDQSRGKYGTKAYIDQVSQPKILNEYNGNVKKRIHFVENATIPPLTSEGRQCHVFK
jgi:hypothetical protein